MKRSDVVLTYERVRADIIARDDRKQIVHLLQGIYSLLYGIADHLDIFEDDEDDEDGEEG